MIMAGSSLDETLVTAGESLGQTVIALRSTHGALVTDISILR